MHIEFDYVAAERCCHVRISGTVHTADVMRSLEDAWARPEYVDAGCALRDYSQARMHFSDEELSALNELMQRQGSQPLSHAGAAAARKLAEFARRGRPDRLPARVALIAGSELDFGMMRIYLGYASFDDFEARVFKTAGSAREWLFAQSCAPAAGAERGLRR